MRAESVHCPCNTSVGDPNKNDFYGAVAVEAMLVC